MKIYYYIFYKFYKGSFLFGSTGINEYSSCIFLSVFVSLNLVTVLALIKYVSDVPLMFSSEFGAGLFAFGVIVGNYRILVHENRFKKIEARFKNETSVQKWIGTAFVLVYVFASVYLALEVLSSTGNLTGKGEGF